MKDCIIFRNFCAHNLIQRSPGLEIVVELGWPSEFSEENDVNLEISAHSD